MPRTIAGLDPQKKILSQEALLCATSESNFFDQFKALKAKANQTIERKKDLDSFINTNEGVFLLRMNEVLLVARRRLP